MNYKKSTGRMAFLAFSYTGLLLLTIICLLPFVHLLALSFSSADMANAGKVNLWPKEFNLKAYDYVLSTSGFIKAFGVSVVRVVLGTVIGMVVTVLTAYPLSKTSKQLKGRKYYVAYFYITAFFSGGLVPTYMVISELGLMNTIWSLVLPNAAIFFNIILMVNFFRSIPRAMEESAIIDGAHQFTTLAKIYLPVSKAGIATLLLFIVVFHWNSWFDGLIYMNEPDKYPLQSYLSNLILPINVNMLHNTTGDAANLLKVLSEKSIKAANIFLGVIPIMLVYPFLQKYFIKGIMLGSIKE